MTQYLPPNLLALFAPRDPIPYMPPTCKLPWEKKNSIYHGVGQFVSNFEDPKDTPPPTRVENRDERKERKKKERAEQVAYKLEQDLAMWDPSNDPNIQGDPYKTLFVARINYDSSESKLRREFEMYGPVKRIKLVHDIKSGKPRGYAYIEYEHERDMHSAYKHADGRKIDGRRVLVDVERGRTVKGWRPRRLGGGLGSTRKGGPDVNSKYSGRDEPGKERDRSRSRSRERPERPRRRSRTPERTERRRRSRSREPREVREPREAREPREPRRRRSKSRERKRSPKTEKDEERPNRRRRSRSRHRSRSRDRKRRRSRSRDRKRSKDRVREPKQEPEDGGYVDNGAGDNNEERSEENEEVVIKKEKEDRGYDKHQLPPEIEEGEQVEEMGGYGDGGGEAEEGYNENGDFGEEQGDEDNNDDDDDPRRSKMMESRNYEQQDGGDDNDEGNNDGEEIEEGEAD